MSDTPRVKPSTPPQVRSRWRFLRITLRTLMLLVTILGVWLGWYMNRVHQQRKAVAAIVDLGGKVTYSSILPEDNYGGWGPPLGASYETPVPLWLIKLMGRDYFTRVVGVQSRSIEAIRFIPKLPDVQVVNLSLSPARDADIEILAANRQLTWLYLGDTNVSGSCFVALRELPLEAISLSGPMVRDSTLDELAKLPRLKSLHIESRSAITPACWSKLANLKGLRQLHITNNDLADRAMEAISTLPKLCLVQVEGDEITNLGWGYLTRCRRLNGIDVKSTRITDAGLANLGGLKNLKHIHVHGHRISDDAVAKFKREHPQIQITRMH